MSQNETATQSPYWDDVLPLDEMLQQSLFCLLLKKDPHGDCVAVVMQEDGPTRFRARWLSHDACGITCDADGTLGKEWIDDDLAKGNAELTKDPEAVKRYIWEVMNCHPNTAKDFAV